MARVEIRMERSGGLWGRIRVTRVGRGASYPEVGAWRVDGITPAIATPKGDEREVGEQGCEGTRDERGRSQKLTTISDVVFDTNKHKFNMQKMKKSCHLF